MQLSPKYRSRRGAAGSTLVEALVSIAVTLMLLATAATFLRVQLFALRTQANQLNLQTSTRAFLDVFAREIRRAGQDPLCVKTFSGVTEASRWRIRVQSDLDSDGVVTGMNEDISYNLYDFDHSIPIIQRTASGSTTTLIDGVDFSGSCFRYFDAAGIEIVGAFGTLSAAQRAQVRRVRVELALADQGLDPQNPTTLQARASTDIDLRNRFFINGTACP